jgi:hypothetical protein
VGITVVVSAVVDDGIDAMVEAGGTGTLAVDIDELADADNTTHAVDEAAVGDAMAVVDAVVIDAGATVGVSEDVVVVEADADVVIDKVVAAAAAVHCVFMTKIDTKSMPFAFVRNNRLGEGLGNRSCTDTATARSCDMVSSAPSS